jgi:type III secretion protein J
MRPLWAFLFLALLGLAGCKQALYSQLSEQEANEVFAALSRTGISSNKVSVNDKYWGIEVDPNDIPAAVETLNRVGLPRSRFASLGDMFKREGIVSTPTEERVRFLHGVSQELSHTLSTIDGVIAARVHLVMPQNDPLADKTRPSSASVFIKHRADLDLQPMVSSIKSLVLRSVEGLTHDAVYVSLFAAEPPLRARGEPPYAPLLGMSLPRELANWLNPLAWLLTIGVPLLLAFGLYRYRSLVRADMGLLRARIGGPGALKPRAVAPLAATDNAAPDQRVVL